MNTVRLTEGNVEASLFGIEEGSLAKLNAIVCILVPAKVNTINVRNIRKKKYLSRELVNKIAIYFTYLLKVDSAIALLERKP